MKRQSLLILLSLILTVFFASQAGTRRILNVVQNSVPESTVIDQGYMEFVYDYRFNADTISNQSIDSEPMLLQIGKNGISKFSSWKNLTVDSILPTLTADQITANINKLVNGPSINIFKNMPEGKLTHTEKVYKDWLRYEEDMPAFDWQLTDSVKDILGYECRQAKTSFRGREWTAYYTEEIPVMDGPWKLHGLPGLILEAHDAKSHYAFICTGIKAVSHRPLTLYNVPYNNTTRKKLYDTLHRYDINPYGYAHTVGGVKITVTDEAGNPDPTAFDPIDIDYDYLERDWRDK